MAHTKVVMKALVVVIMICMSACCGANTHDPAYEPPTYRPLPTLSTGMTTSEVLQLWGEPQEKQVVTSEKRFSSGTIVHQL